MAINNNKSYPQLML